MLDEYGKDVHVPAWIVPLIVIGLFALIAFLMWIMTLPPCGC